MIGPDSLRRDERAAGRDEASPGGYPRPGKPMLIRLREVSVTYAEGGLPALNAVDLSLAQHDAILVIGASGAGKSTLALLLAGLIPDSVTATVTGKVDRDLQLREPGAVGIVFQDPESQFCQLTVGQEVAFGLENIRHTPAGMPPVIARALQAAGLAVPLDTPDYALSGGMQQKLALAAALAPSPHLLIFDEPTANLDPESTGQVFSQIAQLVRDRHSVVVIEHKFRPLLDIMPRVVLLDRNGHIHRDGPTSTVIQQEWSWLIGQGLVEDAPNIRGPEATTTGPSRAPTRPVLAAEGVRFTYASRRLERRLTRNHVPVTYALEDISLAIGGGELVAIVGPNGSGKSTLLSLLGGLCSPSAGVLTRPQPRPGLSVPVAFGFQNPEHQFIFERVVDELANRYVEGSIPANTQRLLETFSLPGHAYDSPFGLSQGQKRRLSVAVMIRDRHDAYLLDEPTFGQDQATQRTIMQHLQALTADGRAVVISTHDMDLVHRYATRVIVLVDGRIRFDGTPEALSRNAAVQREARLTVSTDAQSEPAQQVLVRPSRFIQVDRRQALSPIGRLNPGWKLITTMGAMILAMMAHTVPQGVLLVALPLCLLWAGARLSWLQIAKRMAPFIGFFVLYTWTLTAYSRIGPHTPTMYWLWFRLSWTGFRNGLVLALRMLASVAFGVLYVSTTDVSQLVVSLTRNFHVPPKFSYGSLAGIRMFPLFEEEWAKIRKARMLRGKELHRSRWTRLVTYALPLLTQAIRMGERVAVAMESRGFRKEVALTPEARSYYLETPISVWDFAYLAIVLAASILVVTIG